MTSDERDKLRDRYKAVWANIYAHAYFVQGLLREEAIVTADDAVNALKDFERRGG